MNKLTNAKRVCGVSLGLAILALCAGPASASDWPRFHGPDGNGISPDTQPRSGQVERNGESAMEMQVAGARLVQPHRGRPAGCSSPVGRVMAWTATTWATRRTCGDI